MRDNMTGNMLIGALIAGGVILLITYYKNHHVLSGLLLTAVQGICAFFAVNIIGTFFGVHLNANLLSLFVSAFGGTPGVILLLVLNTFLP